MGGRVIEYRSIYKGKINEQDFLSIPDAEVWVNPDTMDLVVIADPIDEDGVVHNCDEMGCGSFCHVVLRGKATNIGY